MSKMSKELPEILWLKLAKNLDGDRSKKAKKRDGLSVATSLGGQLDKQGGGEGLKWAQYHEVTCPFSQPRVHQNRLI